MHLEGEEFVRRYLLHILPKGFCRIRHYGFLANRCREQKLARIRRALETSQTPERIERRGEREEGIPCPICKAGRLLLVAELPARMPWESIAQRR